MGAFGSKGVSQENINGIKTNLKSVHNNLKNIHGKVNKKNVNGKVNKNNTQGANNAEEEEVQEHVNENNHTANALASGDPRVVNASANATNLRQMPGFDAKLQEQLDAKLREQRVRLDAIVAAEAAGAKPSEAAAAGTAVTNALKTINKPANGNAAAAAAAKAVVANSGAPLPVVNAAANAAAAAALTGATPAAAANAAAVAAVNASPLLSNTNKALAKASEEVQGASTERGSYTAPVVPGVGNNSNRATQQLSQTNAARNAQARANNAERRARNELAAKGTPTSAPGANLFAGLTVTKGGRKRRAHTRSRRNRRNTKKNRKNRA
jgi:hypothetical protein